MKHKKKSPPPPTLTRTQRDHLLNVSRLQLFHNAKEMAKELELLRAQNRKRFELERSLEGRIELVSAILADMEAKWKKPTQRELLKGSLSLQKGARK